MRKQTPIPKGVKDKLCKMLKSAKNKSEFQRVQCMWLRAEFGFDSEVIGKALGWNPVYVRQIHAQFLRQGEEALKASGKGGRYHAHLSVKEEKDLLSPFLAAAEKGGALGVTAIKAAYENLIGQKVPKSTVYRMLERHGWRKIAPRPHHPKADQVAQAVFKKTSRNS
jgi:transposase